MSWLFGSTTVDNSASVREGRLRESLRGILQRTLTASQKLEAKRAAFELAWREERLGRVAGKFPGFEDDNRSFRPLGSGDAHLGICSVTPSNDAAANVAVTASVIEIAQALANNFTTAPVSPPLDSKTLPATAPMAATAAAAYTKLCALASSTAKPEDPVMQSREWVTKAAPLLKASLVNPKYRDVTVVGKLTAMLPEGIRIAKAWWKKDNGTEKEPAYLCVMEKFVEAVTADHKFGAQLRVLTAKSDKAIHDACADGSRPTESFVNVLNFTSFIRTVCAAVAEDATDMAPTTVASEAIKLDNKSATATAAPAEEPKGATGETKLMGYVPAAGELVEVYWRESACQPVWYPAWYVSKVSAIAAVVVFADMLQLYNVPQENIRRATCTGKNLDDPAWPKDVVKTKRHFTTESAERSFVEWCAAQLEAFQLSSEAQMLISTVGPLLKKGKHAWHIDGDVWKRMVVLGVEHKPGMLDEMTLTWAHQPLADSLSSAAQREAVRSDPVATAKKVAANENGALFSVLLLHWSNLNVKAFGEEVICIPSMTDFFDDATIDDRVVLRALQNVFAPNRMPIPAEP